MDFSYNYCTTMSRFSSPDSNIYNFSGADSQSVTDSPVEMKFMVTKEGGDIPIMAYNETIRIMREPRMNMEENQFITIVVPLILGDRGKTCSGADTIMKTFTQRYGRLNKVITPKGEIYYGGNGVVLDKDFNPLIYVTQTLNFSNNITPKTTVHVSPAVFTDDVSSLNKSLLKKGIAYYLTHDVGGWGQHSRDRAEIVIDNGADLFIKPVKPTPGIDINKDINSILKARIGEVLEQIKYDGRSF